MFAIWLPMLPGDERGAWDRSVLDDPRVVSLWDGERRAGRWFADNGVGDLAPPGGVVWDAFYGFGADSRWEDRPTGLVAAGSTIIDNTDRLEKSFVPLLG